MIPDISIERLIMIAPPILFALTFHEFAHAWTAKKFNDDTAEREGRLTLNPLAHLDPVGTILIFIAGIGWARPVPVDPRNLQNPRQDMLWIALAGPISNVILAVVFGFILTNLTVDSEMTGTLYYMLNYGVSINLVLCFFNLIPLPPLDGSKVLVGLLPAEQAYKYSRLEQYGPGLLIGLLVLDRMTDIGILSSLIYLPMSFFRGVIFSLL